MNKYRNYIGSYLYADFRYVSGVDIYALISVVSRD